MAKRVSPDKQSKEDGFYLVDLRLTSLSAQRVGPSDEVSEVLRKNSVELAEVRGRFFTVKANERIYFKAEGPFRLDLEVTGRFASDQPVDEPSIMSELERVSQPVLSYASYVAGIATRELLGFPVIMEPAVVKE